MNYDNTLRMECAIQATKIISTDLWKDAAQAKKNFLEYGTDPSEFPCILPEVAKSWVRSRANGIDPYAEQVGYVLKSSEYASLKEDKRLLIQITSTFLKYFEPLLVASHYTLSLTDEKGIVLLNGGEKKQIESWKRMKISTGTVLSEETAGTTAHSLSIHHGVPAQIIGPYNYCMAFQDNISSSAPIFDENNEILGTLVVVQMVAKDKLQSVQAHSLGWVTSMACAIEETLKVEKQNYYLCLMNATLEKAMAAIDEGLVTIDQNGYINQVNKEGARIFHIPAAEMAHKHFTEFMPPQLITAVVNSLQYNNAVQNFEIPLSNDKNPQPYFISIEPILDSQDQNAKTEGIVMRITPSDKTARPVTRRDGATAAYKLENILGNSACLTESISTAKMIGKKPINVLLTGESGTGKELFAQGIHNEYKPEGPFVAINCASLPRNLIESELFGYDGGAFTGADRLGRPGKIELANGGTLFLDEIGDMPPEIQPSLLRVLEDRKVMRIGGQRYIPVDFRIIAATNKDLLQMVHEKTFREDLYYRLSVFRINIPPLRDRGDDILFLAQHFINVNCTKIGGSIPVMSAEVCSQLTNYNWPGNVRQLENAMIYAVNMAQSGVIKLNHLPDEILNANVIDKKLGKLMSLKQLEKLAIKDALEHTANNTGDAAKILGIGRTTLYRKLKDFEITIN